MVSRFVFALTLLLGVAQASTALCDHQKPVVRFGINLRHRPIPLYERYQPLMDYLTRTTPYRFELKVSRNYQEALKDLEEGRTQLASLGDGASLDAIQSRHAVPVVRPLNAEGKPFYRSMIVVLDASPVTKTAELRGKSFAFGSRHSVSGNLIPRLLLARQGISSSELGHAANLENHTAVAKAVLKGIFEAGAVKDVFAQKFAPFGLRVIAVSEPIPSPPLLASAQAPKEIVAAVAQSLLRLDPRKPEDRRIMSVWDREFRHGFTPATATDYRDLFVRFRAIPNGCGMSCHR